MTAKASWVKALGTGQYFKFCRNCPSRAQVLYQIPLIHPLIKIL